MPLCSPKISGELPQNGSGMFAMNSQRLIQRTDLKPEVNLRDLQNFISHLTVNTQNSLQKGQSYNAVCIVVHNCCLLCEAERLLCKQQDVLSFKLFGQYIQQALSIKRLTVVL